MMMVLMMMMQTAKQSRCCSQQLTAATIRVHGQSKMVDDLLSWTSETLSVLTTNFNAVQPDDLKLADSQLKQHAVSTVHCDNQLQFTAFIGPSFNGRIKTAAQQRTAVQ